MQVASRDLQEVGINNGAVSNLHSKTTALRTLVFFSVWDDEYIAIYL